MGGGRYYLHDQPGALRVELRGRLDSALLEEILACLSTARSMLNGRPVVFDLRRAAPVDGEASRKLASVEGAQTTFLTHDEQAPAMAAALQRQPRLVKESRIPPLRRAPCFLLRLLRPASACCACQPVRIWSL